MYVMCGDNMKKIVLLVLFVAISAFSKDTRYEWTDENGCSYCLYGVYEDGKCKHVATTFGYYVERWTFGNKKLGDDHFFVDYPHWTLDVYCKNRMDYCKTINDPLIIKLTPSLKERKSFCKNHQKEVFNKVMRYHFPIKLDDIKFLCDFVSFDYKKSILNVLDTGVCPVRMKTVTTGFKTKAIQYSNLHIRNLEKFKINENIGLTLYEDKLFIKTEKGPMNDSILFYKKDLFTLGKKDFFTLGECSNSNCEILNYIDKQPQDFDIKCNFIKKKENQITKVQVVGKGVCPIEITGKNNEKQVHYVRSVKDGDAYRLLMTNKRK